MTPTAEGPRPTQDLADYFSGFTVDQAPADVGDRAKLILLDSIACALAADRSQETSVVSAMAEALGSAGETTVLGVEQRRSVGSATLLNGFRITAMTACDVYRPAHCHMTPEVVPPALAIAEQVSATGRALLTSLIAGFETAVRVARGMATDEFRARRWHAPGVVGQFGGAAAAASLLGLDSLATRNALAIAGSQASGTYVAHGTPTVKFHQAHGALSGLLGALLASGGFKGAVEVLAGSDGGLFNAYAGGGDPAAVVAGLGEHWELSQISLRFWPGGTYVQPPMTAAHKLVSAQPLNWEEIAKVRVRVAPSVVASQSKYSRPNGTFECLASVEYTVASMLRWHRVSLDYFMPDVYDDPALRQFIEDRVEMVPDDRITPLGSAVDITMRDESELTSEIGVPKGHPDDRLSWGEVAAKAHDFGDDRLSPASVDELIGRVRNLEEERSVADLLALTRIGSRTHAG